MIVSQLEKLASTLTDEQKYSLLNRLRDLFFGGISKEITLCPCCNSTNFVKNGSPRGVQRYKCKNTSQAFTYKTKTILSGVKKLDKLTQLIDLLSKGRLPTIREISRELNISMQTAFDFRTKILTAIYEDIELSNNLIEFDEKNFRLSRKGRKGMKYTRKRGKKLVGDNDFNIKVFISYSRTTKKLELYASHMGRTSSNDVENYLGTKKDLAVYSDKHNAYVKFYKDRDITSNVFKSSDHVSKTKKEVHNQNVNYFSGLIEREINDGMRGVSTKYLQGYLNWIMFVQNNIKHNVPVKEKVGENRVALDIFKQKEREFKYFLRNNGRNNYGTYNDRYYGKAA
jgi:transposase-like protein